MENKLVSILEELELEQEFDVILQGTIDPNEGYPENFFSYWNWETPRGSYYDNKHTNVRWGFQIIAYSTDRNFLNEMTKKAIEELEKNNFIIDSEGEDIASNLKSHTGKMIEIYFIEKKEE